MEKSTELDHKENGYFQATVDEVPVGSLYLFQLDESKERPDPASRSQPHGVHGPSEAVDPAFPWEDKGWQGLHLENSIFYEIHTGAFTPEGTFGAIIPYLDTLRDLGITTIELMPVAQFPGTRNWGYDGVYPFAVQDSYGGSFELKNWSMPVT